MKTNVSQMPAHLRTVLGTCVMIVCASMAVIAQTAPRPCQPPDATSAWLLRNAVLLLTDTSSGMARIRASVQMPIGAAGDVELVQNPAECDAATAGVERRSTTSPFLETFIVVKMRPAGRVFYLLVERGFPIRPTFLLDEHCDLLFSMG